MELIPVLLAVAAGYLLGSISFARLVARLAGPGDFLSHLKIQVPGTDDYVESDVISATTVRLNVGPQYGCLTSVLDMLKAAVPALAFRLWQPDQPYYLIAALMAVVGHIWPVYYRFRGGRGLSTVMGGLLVLDWAGILLANLVGFLIGIVRRDMLVITSLGIVLMIPWIWFTTYDWGKLAYIIITNILYWVSMVPELQQYRRLRKEGNLQAFRHAQQLRVIRPDGSERYETMTLSSMIARMKRRSSRNRQRTR